jgi:hypothetical protein
MHPFDLLQSGPARCGTSRQRIDLDVKAGPVVLGEQTPAVEIQRED